jgi:hypothetical protein
MLKKILKVMAFVVVALITLIALVCVEESVRGKAAWQRNLRELEARGETLDLLKLAPPPVPDAQNMAAAPIFAELMIASNQDQTRLVGALKKVSPKDPPVTDGQQQGQRVDLAKWRVAFSNENLLAALQPAAAVLQEVADAAARPQCRFPIQYEKGFTCLLPHLSSLLKCARTLQLRALAELEAGQGEAALKDVRLMLRLANSLENEPMLISQLVRMSCLRLAAQTAWEGLAAQRWNDAQLQQLQQDLAAINLLAQLESAFRGERCMAKWALDMLLDNPGNLQMLTEVTDGKTTRSTSWLWHALPMGFLYFNCLNVDLFYQRQMLPCVDSRAGRIYPARTDAIEPACVAIKQHAFPYHVLEALMIPAVSKVVIKAGVAQTSVQQATLACAVERYRLAHGKWPEKLEALVPQYLAKLPADVIDGQPLRYRLDGTAGYVLYSIGWNQQDDGGVPVLTRPVAPEKKPRTDDKQGDWVWRSKPAP